MTRTLYLIDGHSQMFKAYYAIRNLSNSRGEATNMVFGFLQILNRIFKEFEPEFIAIIFDSKGKVFRNDIYPDYKANRDAPPEDLVAQMPIVFDLMDAYGIPQISLQGFEADDLIASYSKEAIKEDFQVKILSSDKDLYQLVDDKVNVITSKNDAFEFFDPEKVKEKMGVYPELMLDFQGLVGDSVDNIPGIKKVGPKTAVKLLDEFGTLEDVLENAEKIKSNSIRERVMNEKENARISKQLATLKIDLELPLPLDQLKKKGEDKTTLAKMFHQLEFRQYQKQYPLNGAVPDEPANSASKQVELKKDYGKSTKYHTITTEEQLAEWAKRFTSAELIAFDTETDEVDPMRAELVGISISDKATEAIYIPVGHASLIDPQLEISLVREHLDPIFSNPKIAKSAQNAKFDLKILERNGFEINGLEFDTQVAAYILAPDERIGLKKLSKELLGIEMTEISELIGKGANQISMRDVEIEDASPYACMDADITFQLTHHLRDKLKENQLEELYYNIEQPLINILHQMEMAGVKIDSKYFKVLSEDFKKQLTELAEKIYEISGKVFTINSPKQVAEILFEDLELPTDNIKKGKSGVYSTDVSVLESLAPKHPLPKLLLEYRQFEKLKGTYVDPLPRMIHPKTGRIHSNFSQTIAATGRLSSNHPNLQNIPVKTENGRKIRQGFIPEKEGHVFLAADYSQIELRVLAHITRDPSLIKAFKEDIDIHNLTASKILGVEQDQVDKAMRSHAKVVNFGIIYGMSAFRLSNELEIPRATAKKFIEDYFSAYPGVKDWSEKIISEAVQKGFVETLSGRKRPITNLTSRNFNTRSAAERITVNTPIQGTAADMIKMAMINMDKVLKEKKFNSKMILQIHDELIFEVPENEIEDLKTVIPEVMESAMPLDVPVKVDVKIGNNWAEV